ncbi:MAG: DUF2208 domain-containing protein [Desulfurococcales archaeon]|nr:DUF2208 domain-containing protein [Desulfurococcales archaeon]
MAYIENIRARLLISQVFVLVYSALVALLGRTSETFLVVFILLILYAFIQSRRSKGPLGQGKVRPDDVLASKILYKEDNIRELQAKDEKLLPEIQEQSKFMLYTSLGSFLSIGYFIALWGITGRLADFFYGIVGEQRLADFLAFFIFFEGLFMINHVAMLYAMKKVGIVKIINMPQSYIVTAKGIVLKGLVMQSAIGFPLPSDVRMVLDEKRGFVEIVKEGKRSITKIRLYSRSPKRLYNIIRKHSPEIPA